MGELERFTDIATWWFRDVKRFKWHEEGRGVVKAWVKFVVDSTDGMDWKESVVWARQRNGLEDY